MSSILSEENRYFDENIDKLLERYTGKILLIKGSRLIAVFESPRAALKEGTRMFGREPFSVRFAQSGSAEIHVEAFGEEQRVEGE